MSEWLCESCKHRKGKLRPTSTYDTCGTEYSYTGSMKVNCTSPKKRPWIPRDAVRKCDECWDYKRKGK